jgi:creatinine amidohydrolase
MRFGDLTYQEIRERAETGWLAVVPTGCTEQQGPHLPVDFDTWFAETLCLAAARQAAATHGVHALVLPAVPFGPTPEHRGFGAGYIHLPQELHQAVVASILDSLAGQGFRRIVVWRGCGGHALGDVVRQFNAAHAGQAQAFQPDFIFYAIWCKIGDPAVPGGHADSFATSIALYLRPESVRAAQIYDPKNAPVDWDDPNLDFARYSSSGVIGDPTHASAELGAELWRAVVEDVALTLKRVAGANLSRCQETEA